MDVEIEAPPGVTALFGPSGAGKSTVLQVIAGLERGGRHVRVNVRHDNEIWQDDTRFVPPHRRGVGYVFQQPQLFQHLTVLNNLRYAEKRARLGQIVLDDVVDWLDINPLLQRSTGSLSGGEAQRVAIARTLLSNPRCLLMDEPLGSLDGASRRKILPYLARLRSTLDIPVIYVTHAIDEVSYLADHVLLIRAGSIIEQGSVFDMASSLQLSRETAAEPAAVIETSIAQYHEADALAECRIDGAALFVACGPLPAGERVRIRIPARDVSLSMSQPEDSSILNILPAVVQTIDESPLPHAALVRLTAGEHTLVASVTHRSRRTLGLAPGQRVFAQVKGVALLTDHG